MTSTRRTPLLAVLAFAAWSLTACAADAGGGPDAAAEDGATPGSAAPASAGSPNSPAVQEDDAEFDLAAFCEVGEPLLVPVERSYVGTDEHVEQFRALGEVAPEDLVDAIAILELHYDLAVTPTEPESQNWDTFPAEVQAAAIELTGAIEERCAGDA